MFDTRIAVAFGTVSDVNEGDAVLSHGLTNTGGHAPGCACCTSRTAAAEALSRLFMQRARGEVAFFTRVLVIADTAGKEAVRSALQSDPVAAARFRPV